MKNIAVMTPSLNSGGAERIAGLLSKYLSEKYNVYVFADDIENQVYEYGGKLVHIGSDGIELREYTMQYYKKLYKIDCAISFLECMSFANIRTRCNEKVIVSERCTQSLFNPPYYHDFENEMQLYNQADKVIAVAEGVKYDLVHNYGIESSRIDTIYNFIDQNKILKRSEEKLPDEIESFIGNSKLIINVGRLNEQKNQKKLLIQFSLLLKDGIDAKLIILGSGPLKKGLAEAIARLKIEAYVRIIEYNANPFPLYKRADVFALSSDFEGLPNVILEAMVLGTPVVSTDCLSGPRELLDGDFDYSQNVDGYQICRRGILVTTVATENDGTTHYFKDALKRMLEDSELCKSIINSQLKYMSEYTNQSILQKWIEAIEEPFEINKNSALKKTNHCSKQIILYGAGWFGRRVLTSFLEKKDDMELLCFAVTSLENNVKAIAGIPVYQIDELIKYRETADVIISVTNRYADEVLVTLKSKGFTNLYFPFFSKPYNDYLDYRNLDENGYEKELSLRYLNTYGEKLSWDNPQKYSEKIQTLKLCSKGNRECLLLDKYYARKYVEGKIGKKYLPDFLGVWQSFDEIDFEKLPNSFILVCTHGKNWKISVDNREKVILHNVGEKIKRWMSLNYAYITGLDQRYRNIVPRVMAEKNLYDDKNAKTYKFLIFDGRVKMIEMCDGQLFEWDNDFAFRNDYLILEMIALSEKIGEGMQHIVVELKTINNHIFFHDIDLEYGNENNPIDSKNDIIMGDYISF